MTDTPNPLDDLVDLDGEKVKFYIDPSKIRVALITAGSLFTFSALAIVSVVKLMAARDFIGLWLLLQKEETLSAMFQLAGLLFFIWRVVRSVRKKGVEVEIVRSSPIAALTTELYHTPVNIPGRPAAPPRRDPSIPPPARPSR